MLNAVFLLKVVNGIINTQFLLEKLYIRVPVHPTRYYNFINIKYYTTNYANFDPFLTICSDFNNLYLPIDFNKNLESFKVITCLGKVDDVQPWSRFSQKCHNWWRIIGVWLWHWKKGQTSQWQPPEEPWSKKTHQVQSNVKVLITVFFDCNGVMHHEFFPQGRMVN